MVDLSMRTLKKVLAVLSSSFFLCNQLLEFTYVLYFRVLLFDCQAFAITMNRLNAYFVDLMDRFQYQLLCNQYHYFVSKKCRSYHSRIAHL